MHYINVNSTDFDLTQLTDAGIEIRTDGTSMQSTTDGYQYITTNSAHLDLAQVSLEEILKQTVQFEPSIYKASLHFSYKDRDGILVRGRYFVADFSPSGLNWSIRVSETPGNHRSITINVPGIRKLHNNHVAVNRFGLLLMSLSNWVFTRTSLPKSAAPSPNQSAYFMIGDILTAHKDASLLLYLSRMGTVNATVWMLGSYVRLVVNEAEQEAYIETSSGKDLDRSYMSNLSTILGMDDIPWSIRSVVESLLKEKEQL